MARLPDFLIIGAMKSGTTSLHHYLDQHPDIFMSDPKEIHYYADEDYLNRTLDWYTSHFKTTKKLAGSSPQSYTKRHNKYYKNIPERIKKHNPHVKMIYIVRDPVKRYQSHLVESMLCDPQEDIEYSMESDNYLLTSKYYYQLSHYLEYFEMKQIHVLSLESLVSDPLGEMNKIFDFLGVKAMKSEDKFDFIVNKKNLSRIPRRINGNYLYRFGKKVAPGITMKIASSWASRINRKYLEEHKPDEKELHRIQEALKTDVADFRKLTGMKFPEWSI